MNRQDRHITATVMRESSRLMDFIRRRVADPADAEDILQFAIRHIEPGDFQSLGLLQRLKLRLHGMAVSYTPNADACRACGLCVAK